MASRSGRKSVERSTYREFERVADHFRDAAADSMELQYCTAASVLIVHSAIAYADALSIKQAGLRSASNNHDEAVTHVDESVASSERKAEAMQQLRRIVGEKTRVSYLGELYSPAGTKRLWQRLERFRRWAKQVLER